MSSSGGLSKSARSSMSGESSESSSKAKSLASKSKKPLDKGKNKQRINSQHPPCSEMIKTAIKDLNEKRGSSFQAIKKYIRGKYCLDVEKISIYIKKFIKSAVASGLLIQTKGTGVIGSFKLNKNMDKFQINKKPSKSSSKLPVKKGKKKEDSLKKKKNIKESKKIQMAKAMTPNSTKFIVRANEGKVC